MNQTPSPLHVDVEEVEAMAARRAAINRVPLAELVLYEHGERIDTLARVREAFAFTGLDNFMFIELRYWEAEKPAMSDGLDAGRGVTEK